MGWKQLNAGDREDRDLIKWDQEGKEIEGLWKGTVEGEYGELGQVETPDGRLLAFPLLSVLERTLEDVSEGTHLKIVYLGKRTSRKSGREYKAFDVRVVGSIKPLMCSLRNSRLTTRQIGCQ